MGGHASLTEELRKKIPPMANEDETPKPTVQNGQNVMARNGDNGHTGVYSKVQAEPLAEHVQGMDVDEDELIVQTHDIRCKFLVLFTQVRRCLESKGVTVRDFVGFLKQVPGYAKKSLFDLEFSNLSEAPDLIAVFESVGEHCSWFNHSLLGLIIETYCEDSKAIKRAHQEYCGHLQKYCKHRVRKFPFKNGFGQGGKRDKMMVMKVDRKWDEIQIDQLEEVMFDIANILKVSRQTLHLCCVEKGCVQLTVVMPSYISEEVLPLTPEQEADMRKIGVIDLKCGSYHFSCQVMSYTLPSPTYKDWLRAWREWARTRKRGKMAQFVVDKLEDNPPHTQKLARWLDITIGKFELTQWHTIAEEWFKEKPRNSDQVDAPCMLRKGLPRAFPGLEEVKAESVKEGTQYRSRVFQATPQLVQEVMMILTSKKSFDRDEYENEILHRSSLFSNSPNTKGASKKPDINYPTAVSQTWHGSHEECDVPSPVEDACACSTLHIQGVSVPIQSRTFTDRPLIPEINNQSDVPSPVEDACTCSTLHIRGGSVYKHYRRCPIHNDTEEHVSVPIQSSTFTDGQSNFVQVDKLPETNCMPEPVENACVCSTLHIQGGSAYKYQKMSNT